MVYEFFMAYEFKWSLHYIRSLPYRDIDMLTTLISVMYKLRGQGKDVTTVGISQALGQIMGGR